MPSAFDSIQRAKFGTQEFPIESCRMHSQLRRHNHEYSPAPGAAVEKMGRTPYSIEMLGNFQATFVNYTNLWPNGVQYLRTIFEQEKTMDLVIPTVGTIKAYLTDWDQSMEAKVRSGEKCQLKFEEDFSSKFLVNEMVKVSSGNMRAAAAKFDARAQERPPVPSIFTQIQNAVNGVLAIKDQANLHMSLIESKILAAIALIKEADRSAQELQNAGNSALFDALQELWHSLVLLAENTKNSVVTPRTWRTPSQMNTFEIAAALYDGDGSRGGDILALNAFEDPFAVPAGSSVRYYPDLGL